MKTNAQWRKAAPWIRRCPTLPERRWEEERKPEAERTEVVTRKNNYISHTMG